MIYQHERMELRDPILIVAFRGWNDAGEAATFAASHLARVWGAEKIASLDPEEFYDFQVSRPQVQLIDGVTRQITWPSNEFWGARLEGGERDALVLVGTEPNNRWRTFTELVVGIAKDNGVRTAVSLGALLADVPHSRPVHVTGTAADRELIASLGLEPSRYEGPTGIVGVLNDALGKAGVAAASLWAAVPHYLAITPNPKVALSLARQTTQLIGIPADVEALELAADAYDQRVSEMVEADDDVTSYVRMLEERSDEREREDSIDPSDLPNGDSLAAELEEFLRERGDAS